jgi:hypothetical protein
MMKAVPLATLCALAAWVVGAAADLRRDGLQWVEINIRKWIAH